MRNRKWTKEELFLAINLYCKTPFGKIHNRNPNIIQLSKQIGRTPSSVSWKMCNFASIDPTLDRKGASHVSKLDIEVWNEFFEDWDNVFEASEKLLKQYLQPQETNIVEQKIEQAGKDVLRLTNTRQNQDIFRKLVLASYDNTCCITGIKNTKLLNASHIIPWNESQKMRLDPRNGLCLNALHDRAFDRGLITLDEDYRVILSKEMKKSNCTLIQEYEGNRIRLPSRFLPAIEFLEYHQQNIFCN